MTSSKHPFGCTISYSVFGVRYNGFAVTCDTVHCRRITYDIRVKTHALPDDKRTDQPMTNENK